MATTDLDYNLTDVPPLFYTLFLALQQIFVVAIYLALVSFVTNAANMPPKEAQSVVSMSLFMMGVATVLQVIRFGPIGVGFVITNCPAVTYFVGAVIAAKLGGIKLVLGMTLFAGVCEILFAGIANRLKVFFPSVVTGLTFTGLGLSVGIMAFQHVMVLSVDNIHQGLSYLVFIITLFTILSLSIWGTGFAKLLSLMIGLIVGCIAAYFSHLFDPTDLLHIIQAPYFALPNLSYLGFSFSWNLAPLFAIAAIAAGLRTYGCVMTSQEINNKQDKNTNKMLSKGTFTDGLAVVLSGLVGTYPVGASPSAIGITKASGATSRVIAYAVACFCILFSFSPKIAAFWISIPSIVVAAGLMVTSSIMFVGGMRLILNKPLDMRNTYIVGISILLALTPMAFPQFYQQFPEIIQTISHSMLSMIAISAILLNIFFYPGKKKKVQLIFNEETISEEQILELAKKTGVDTNLIAKTTRSLKSLLTMIITQKVNDSPVILSLAHDEIHFDINIEYQGTLPIFDVQENFKIENLYEDQVYFLGLSSLFKDLIPDNLSLNRKENRCILNLRFST